MGVPPGAALPKKRNTTTALPVPSSATSASGASAPLVKSAAAAVQVRPLSVDRPCVTCSVVPTVWFQTTITEPLPAPTRGRLTLSVVLCRTVGVLQFSPLSVERE